MELIIRFSFPFLPFSSSPSSFFFLLSASALIVLYFAGAARVLMLSSVRRGGWKISVCGVCVVFSFPAQNKSQENNQEWID